MTDHLAEAQRILNDLHGTVSRAEATAAEMSASALLAIAHTLQAIAAHQQPQPAVGACPARRHTPNQGWIIPCTFPLGHTGAHRDGTGMTWLDTEGTQP